jgi:hypothetical protein
MADTVHTTTILVDADVDAQLHVNGQLQGDLISRLHHVHNNARCKDNINHRGNILKGSFSHKDNLNKGSLCHKGSLNRGNQRNLSKVTDSLIIHSHHDSISTGVT